MRYLHYSAVCPLVTYLRLLVDKELALFVVKFVLEGLINASPKGSLTENIALQVRTYGILVGLLESAHNACRSASLSSCYSGP